MKFILVSCDKMPVFYGPFESRSDAFKYMAEGELLGFYVAPLIEAGESFWEGKKG